MLFGSFFFEFTMLQEIQCRAVAVSSFNYRDYDRIVTFYSDAFGIIKAIVHGANRPKSSKRIFCEPLTYLELVIRLKKGDIHSFKEGKIINAHLDLRNSYDHLAVAMKLLEITSKTQLPGDPSERVFNLLLSTLKKIPSFKNPWILESFFILKILIASGQWTLQSKCSRCHKPLDEFYYSHNGYYCKSCSPTMQLKFDGSEILTLTQLIQERSFTALNEINLSKNLQDKIEKLFLSAYQ